MTVCSSATSVVLACLNKAVVFFCFYDARRPKRARSASVEMEMAAARDRAAEHEAAAVAEARRQAAHLPPSVPSDCRAITQPGQGVGRSPTESSSKVKVFPPPGFEGFGGGG